MTADAFHTGPPAFTTLMPSVPAEEPVAQQITDQVSQYCGAPVTVRALGPVGSTPEGRYIVYRDAATKLFLKIFDARIVELQQHSDRVAAHLGAQGVPVVRPLDGEPRAFAPGFCGELFPYVDARFSRCDRHELVAIGTLLARVHRALTSFDAVGLVRTAADEMHRRLVAVAESILGGATPYAPDASALRDAARGYLADAGVVQRSPQMVHGDCNYTNVLVDRADGQIYLIDFEESRAAWLSPMFDVAKVIERFVLVPAKPQADELAAVLLNAYADAGGAWSAVDMRQMLIASNDRALMIMADKAHDGLALPDAEWRKFVGLKRLVTAQAPLLDGLSSRMANGRIG